MAETTEPSVDGVETFEPAIEEVEPTQEQPTASPNPIPDERRKKLFDIGKEYLMTNQELEKIIQQSTKEFEKIDAEKDEIDRKLAGAMETVEQNRNEKVKVDRQYIRNLERRKGQLRHLRNLNHAVIKAAAYELLKYGDPIGYIIKVFNRLHVGDTELGKVLVLSKACQSILNSEGLQPKLSGPSGKGKTHAANAMYHLLPDTGHKMSGSLSSKSLFYHPDLKPGTTVFSDDVKMSDDLEETLKNAMSKFQEETIHNTVDRNLNYRELVIPERTVWWMTSVKSDFGDELLNRLFGLDVDDSPETDTKVMDWQKKKARHAEIDLPEDKEVFICRAIFHELEKHLFTIHVPYSERITWHDPSDRRNLPRFLDIVRSFTAIRFMQRFEFLDDEYLADEADFEAAKTLWESGKSALTTKLTQAELKLVKWLVGKGALSVNDIVKSYEKSNGAKYTPEAIRKMLEGKYGKGLINKVPGMLVHGSGGKGDPKKYEIPSFDDGGNLEIVSLEPEKHSTTSQESLSSECAD